MSKRKLPPRLYFNKARGRWVIRYDAWMRRTPFTLEQREEAQALLDKLLGQKSWAHAVRSLKPKPRKAATPPWSRGETEGIVYFVSAETEEYPIKIGFCASSMEKRLCELQVGNPHKLVVLATHPATFLQEQAIHAMRQKDRLSGEWFRRSEAILELLEAAKSGRLADMFTTVHVPFCAESVPEVTFV